MDGASKIVTEGAGADWRFVNFNHEIDVAKGIKSILLDRECR